jgi:glycosyltransferase involved in cell wall biosynthesis
MRTSVQKHRCHRGRRWHCAAVLFKQWDLRSAGRIDDFIANSNNVAVKIKSLYGREAAVIYPPADVERFRLAERQEPYYLIVSALVPYKKIDVAIEAFNQLKLPLKIAGEGPLRKRLEMLAEANIEFLGWVTDDALARLYASCQALVFPGEEASFPSRRRRAAGR